MIFVSVSVATNFVQLPMAVGHINHSFWELALFVYCLLQKIKKASSLPLVSQWEEHVTPNRSQFLAIDEKAFLSGTSVMTALEHWEPIFADWFSPWCPSLRRGICDLFAINRCLEITHKSGYELLLPWNCDWWGWRGSFTALQQGLGWAFREGLKQRERNWSVQGWVPVLCAGTVAAWAVVRKEVPWRRGSPVILFCTLLSVLGSTCIKYLTYPIMYLCCICMCGFAIAHETMMFQVVHLTAPESRGPATRSDSFTINLDHLATNEEKEVRGVLLCVQNSVWSPHFTQRSFF